MAKATPIPAAEAVAAETATIAEEATVRLFRKQDRFFAPPMTRTAADEIIAGYPGEYEELTDGEG